MQENNNNKKNNSQENKKAKKDIKLPDKKILIGILAIVVIAIIALAFKNNKVNLKGKNASSKEIDDNSYNQSRIYRVDLNQINSIDFDLSTSDVRIQRSNTNPYVEYTVLFKGEENVYDMDIGFKDGVLSLKNKVSGDKLYMKDKIPIVRIFLPQTGSLDQIKGNIAAGDVKISDLEVKDFNLNLKSGSISIDNSFFTGNIINEAGPINLSKTEIKNTNLKTNVGNINIVDSKLGNKLNFETQTGDIIIDCDKTIDNYDIDARLNVGNFILGNRSYRNITDGFTSENEGKYKISLITKIGDVIFNRGEGAKVDETEYITNDKGPNDSDDQESKPEIEDTETPDEDIKENKDSNTQSLESESSNEDSNLKDENNIDTENENN